MAGSDPETVVAGLEPGRTFGPLPGLSLTKLRGSGFVVARTHYHVDQRKRAPAWAEAAASRYGRLGVKSWKWRREQEIDFTAASGEPVFFNFDRAVHVIREFAIPAHWPRWLMYDPGGANPHSLDWWAMDPTGPDYTLYQYRQWYKGLEMPNKTVGGYFVVSDVMRIAYELSTDPDGQPERLEALIVDSQARATQARQGSKPSERALTLYEEMEETLRAMGWSVPLLVGNNLKDTAIDDILDRLGNYPLFEEDAAGEIRLDAAGKAVPLRDAAGEPVWQPPRLFLHESCVWTAWELGQYRWKDWASDKVAETRNRPEEPVDKNDHAITNLIRLMNHLRPEDPARYTPAAAEERADVAREVVRAWRQRRFAERREEATDDI